MERVKKIAKSVLRPFGIDMRRIPKIDTVDAQLRFGDAMQAQAGLLNNLHHPLILDVGANIGQTVENYLKAFPAAQIHCFEPTPACFLTLQRKYGHSKNIVLNECGLSNYTGSMELQAYEDTSINSQFVRPNSGKRYYPESRRLEPINCRCLTLDAYLDLVAIKQVDILKIDAEGAELLILEGAAASLKKGMIKILYLELGFVARWQGSPLMWDICKFLEEYSYQLFNIYDCDWATNGQLRVGDGIFIGKSVRSVMLGEE